MKQRLDQALVTRGLAMTRSQAENWVRLGTVRVDGRLVNKPGYFVTANSVIELSAREQYVSRAGLKLASVAGKLSVDFAGAIVLDVGSSTGGFTDYALQHGADKVVAVDVGTDQLHASLRGNPRVELHEKTDIRDFDPVEPPDIVVIDVSFISLRDILPHIASLLRLDSIVLAMVKPQFEAGRQLVDKGVIKNDRIRRQILSDFEQWAKRYFVIEGKADSDVIGAKGNRERFYRLVLAR
ncbi:TlyA family rRNA (cytidine-2'-O)-methyltransferase [Candidatus Saccharibacteria bacterium]|nr:MAG: TlyA family rRNA (cytidine-2'-O)-methyltransferase [Candidatus Saccharibacteria bacterium]